MSNCSLVPEEPGGSGLETVQSPLGNWDTAAIREPIVSEQVLRGVFALFLFWNQENCAGLKIEKYTELTNLV